MSKATEWFFIIAVMVTAAIGYSYAQKKGRGGLKATATAHSVTLTWTAPSDAISSSTYNEYRLTGACPSTATGFTQLATANTTTTYVDTAVTAGTEYCYYVTQVQSSDESAPSNTVSATVRPFAPTLNSPTVVQLTSPSGNLDSALLAWNVSADSCSTYNVYRNGAPVTPNSILTDQYVDSGLLKQSTYTWFIEAVCNGISSIPSNSQQLTLQ
jgi:fibronectin type 3 domain-containing protein